MSPGAGASQRTRWLCMGNSPMRSCNRVSLILLLFTLLGCSPQPTSAVNPSEIEMIFWESQSWEAGGGRSRLTIWANGRSEIMVVPDAYYQGRPEALLPREGWSMTKSAQGLHFLRENVYPVDIAKNTFNRALTAGIHLLTTFQPDYVDGGGTLVGVQTDGTLKETLIPMFLGRHEGSANHERFVAVSEVMADFDRDAYDIRN